MRKSEELQKFKKILISAITLFTFSGMLLASDKTCYLPPEQQNNPKKQDIQKIKIGVTTEKEILDLFGEPFLVRDGDRESDLRNSYSYFHWNQKNLERPKPNQKIIAYEFLNSQGGWTGGYLLVVIINKKNNLVEDFRTDYTFEDIIPRMDY